MLKDCCLWIIIPTFAHEYTRGAIPNRLTNVFLGRLMSPLYCMDKNKGKEEVPIHFPKQELLISSQES
jgi:hypothetical protein